MPWTTTSPPPPAQNWTEDEKEKCIAAANAVLREGDWENASEDEKEELETQAIQACIHAAGKSEKCHWWYLGTLEK